MKSHCFFIFHCLSLIGCFSTIKVHAFILPQGLPATATLSERRMYALGQEYMYDLNQQIEIIHDPIISTYLDNLGLDLVKHSKMPNRRFHFFMVATPTVNAFTGPGAFIGVHSGLMVLTESEAEFASVLAHEIGHVTEKHIEHLLEKTKTLKVSTLAGMVAAIALSTINSKAGMGALLATQAGLAEYVMTFSRHNEEAADRTAINILQASHINPNAMITLLKRMEANSHYHPDLPPEYLLTHPRESSRIADLLNRLGKYHKSFRQENPDFFLVRERVRVLASQDKEALLDYYRKALIKNSHNKALHYGRALTLLSIDHYKQTQNEIDILLKDSPNQLFFQLLQADSFGIQRAYSSQLNLLSYLANAHPKSYAVTVAYARALLHHGNAKQATQCLENFYMVRPDVDIAYSLLSHAQAKAGYLASAYQTRASAYLSFGDKQHALIQLKTAEELVENDPNQLAQIQAEIKDLNQK